MPKMTVKQEKTREHLENAMAAVVNAKEASRAGKSAGWHCTEKRNVGSPGTGSKRPYGGPYRR